MRRSIGLMLALAVALAVRAGVERVRRGPDLLREKSWKASSAAFACNPSHYLCGSARTAIFFHTKYENAPWVEFDLGSRQRFNRLTVVNREDCCAERAKPLAFQVSDDDRNWREIARQTQPFLDWEASFGVVTARYVRLQVTGVSVLHLVRVSLYAS